MHNNVWDCMRNFILRFVIIQSSDEDRSIICDLKYLVRSLHLYTEVLHVVTLTRAGSITGLGPLP